MAHGTKLTRIRLDERHADPQEVMEKQLALLEEAQEALGDEFRSGPGGLMRALSDKDSEKLTKLTAAINSLLASKIRMDAHLKKVGESMTQSELLEAAVNKIKALPHELRGPVIRELAKYHEKSLGDRGTFKPAMEKLRDLG